MLDFAAARRIMVDCQVRPNDVTDLRLLEALLDLPREKFLPEAQRQLAYLDFDLAVSEEAGRPARTLLKPMVLAKLIQAATIGEGDHVLDVGCSTGYSSAVIGRLAASVIALEQDAGLVRLAGEALAAVGATNVTVVTGALVAGWPACAPYDAIVINGACEFMPEDFNRQLKDSGRLVCVLGSGPGAKAMLYGRSGSELVGRPIFDAAASLLPGFAKTPEFAF